MGHWKRKHTLPRVGLLKFLHYGDRHEFAFAVIEHENIEEICMFELLINVGGGVWKPGFGSKT